MKARINLKEAIAHSRKQRVLTRQMIFEAARDLSQITGAVQQRMRGAASRHSGEKRAGRRYWSGREGDAYPRKTADSCKIQKRVPGVVEEMVAPDCAGFVVEQGSVRATC